MKTKLWLIKLWLIIISFLLIFIPSAKADHGTLGHWGVHTITVADLTGDVEWRIAIREAVSQWNAGMDYIELVSGTAATCSPNVERVIAFCFTSDLPPGWLGDARHTYREEHIVHVQIALRQHTSWKPVIACHELGHALGLWHRAQNSNSCLVPIIGPNTNPNPDEHDYKEVNKLHDHRDIDRIEL